MYDRISRYLDLYADYRADTAAHHVEGWRGQPHGARWTVLLYAAVIAGVIIAGVIIQNVIDSTAPPAHVRLPTTAPPALIFSLILAITIFPAVYKKAFNRSDPSWVQVCLVFAAALGYETFVALSAAAYPATLPFTHVWP